MSATALSSEDFDAAKAVFEQLKDLPRERQERVLRWILEGLGIVATAPAHTGSPARSELAPPAPQTIGIDHPTPASNSGSGRDIKSFVAEKAPNSDNQFAAVVAYYYRFEAPPAQRRDAIDGTVLQDAARLAGRARLSKPRYTLNNAKSAGYLDSAGRGQFGINSVGENLVAMALPGEGNSAAGAAKTGNRKPTKKATKKAAKRTR